MLPARPARPTQDIHGSRLQNLPQRSFALGIFLHGPWPKLHRACADQRYTNDYIESWRVTMPADSGARRIISHEQFGEFFCIPPGELIDARPQWQKELRDLGAVSMRPDSYS